MIGPRASLASAGCSRPGAASSLRSRVPNPSSSCGLAGPLRPAGRAPRRFAAALCASALAASGALAAPLAPPESSEPAGPGAAARTAFYGKANARLHRRQRSAAADGSTERAARRNNWELHSNASRLGFRASARARAGLEALFQAEYEIGLDDGGFGVEGKPFRARNVYAGVKGAWGELQFGRNDTLLKSLGKAVWAFADADNGDYLQGDDRRDDMVLYQSARWRGFRFGAAFSPAERAERGGPEMAHYAGFSVDYEREGRFVAGLAVNRALSDARALPSGAPPPSGALSGFRATARWTGWPGFRIGAIVQRMRDAAGAGGFDERGAALCAVHRRGDWRFKLQRGASRRRGGAPAANGKHRQLALGAEYRLDESVTLFAHFFSTRNASAELGGAPATDDMLGAGMEYRF